MIINSLYPDVPPLPPVNIHDVCFNRPDVRDIADYTMYIDGRTGQKTSYLEFKQRIGLVMTALNAPVAEGGLRLLPEDGHIVGILSPNCVVRFLDVYCE